MEKQSIMSHVDHTLLKPECTAAQIEQLCGQAVRYGCATVCVPPSQVAVAADCLKGRLPVCTVIGFPNGYATTAVKAFEARDAIQNGAEEIDMVANIGWIKEGRWDALTEEIRCVKAACGSHILKVIVETCLLTQEEKTAMCQVVSDGGADYIKTSTGFSTGGATAEDVALFKSQLGDRVKIKAAGGISSFRDAQEMLDRGADRLGTSRLVRLLQEEGQVRE